MDKKYYRDWMRRWRASMNEEARANIRHKDRESKRQWYAGLSAAEKEKLVAAHRAYRRTLRGKAVYIKSVRKWDARNPVKKAAINGARRARLLQRTPWWLTPDEHWMMEEAYDLAARRSALKSGGHAQWHVDHIVPLAGKAVSGLHVPWNLQVITAVANKRKHNHV